MDEGIKEYTKTGKMKCPSYLLAATWVKETWEAININLIRRFFKCCGISNMMDRTEDKLIFDFTNITNETNLKRGVEGQEESNDKKEEEDSANINTNEGGLVYNGYYEEDKELTIAQDWN
ncbi:19616_t:CDS:1 [Racocetra persica]|uniref:19616_t:CDS:1 n=1 Tax=Racocetra persica TaxID=160502 RepID=A0ACA9QL05_9GLOM|nr:19616_t:CDS:1 [Racocetra persica]